MSSYCICFSFKNLAYQEPHMTISSVPSRRKCSQEYVLNYQLFVFVVVCFGRHEIAKYFVDFYDVLNM